LEFGLKLDLCSAKYRLQTVDAYRCHEINMTRNGKAVNFANNILTLI